MKDGRKISGDEFDVPGEVLLESEEKFRAVFMSAPVGIAIAHPEGRFIAANESFCRMLGYEERELRDKTFVDITHPKDRETTRKLAKEALYGQRNFYQIEKRYLTKEGRHVWASTRATAISDASGQILYWLGIVQDITERKRAEQTIRKQRDRAQKYLDIAGVLMVVINASQRVTLINKRGCELLGYREEEIVGKNWFDCFLPERDRDRVRAGFVQLIAGEVKPAEYFENPVLTQSGEERIIAWHNTILTDEAGNVTHTLSSGEDITERKRAEEELRIAHEELERRVEERTAELKRINERLEREIVERRQVEETLRASEERHRSLLESSPDPIVVYDMEGRATYLNPAFVRTFGWPREELVGKRIDYVPEKNWEETKAGIERMVRGERVQSFETRRLTKDGRTLDIHLSSSRFSGRSGKPAGNIVILRDITEARQMEEALERMRIKLLNLQESERSSIARVLHDTVGQNISILDFNLTTMEEVLDDSSKKRISQLSSNMRSVIRETGDKLRDIASGLHPRDVQELGLVVGVKNFIERFRRGTNLEVSSTIEVNELDLEEGVSINLYRIIQEIFTNILKHAKCQSVDFHMAETDNRLVLSVRDNGIGFSKEEVADRDVENRGMGLFIIQERVKAINGELLIRSEPKLGTEVEVGVTLL